MTKIGAGLNKVANLAYRAQFSCWAVNIKGRFNTSSLSANSLAFLIHESGIACGIGEWRCEKSGVFGSYYLADADEEAAWNAFAKGTGPLPVQGVSAEAAE